MAADDSELLPQPPPPRPARRDAAIDAALRRFDREPAATPEPPASRSNSWTRHPQLGLALAASLVVVIGLPAAFIVLRDQGTSPAQVSTPPSAPSSSRQAVPPEADYEAENAVVPETPTEPRPVDQLAKVQSVAPPVQADEKQAVAVQENVANDLPAVAPPPPPPPPPPPAPAPPPAMAEKSAQGAAANELVVTGSRVRQPNPATVSDLASREQGSAAAARAETSDSEEPRRSVRDSAHAAFVTRLQAAVRANNRNGVIALVDFPLRVNERGRSRFYRDARSVRANYERIFTPKVTRAILGQRASAVFGNQYGWMIGNGEVWFDQTCVNAACSPPGPIRIKSINL